MTSDEIFMHRCLTLASNGLGRTYPNPLVGSVIVYNNKIIGEGFHKRAGEPHAEVIAINSVKNKNLLKQSTLYVNLEPCSHYGKTPPCADLIIKWQIPRVVIGTIDTSSKVSGKGIEKLKKAGIDVKVGVLEKDSRWINRRFFTFHEKKRPYIILKWAQTTDGFIDKIRDNNLRHPTIITSKFARTLVHKWRSEEQAIAVGTNTVIKDNPKLNVRLWYGSSPLRICTDIKQRIPKNSNIFSNQEKTICLTEAKYYNPKKILEFLYNLNIQSIIIEGGTKFINSFVNQELWDESRIFISKFLYLNGIQGPQITGKLLKVKDIHKETLYIFSHEKNSGFIYNFNPFTNKSPNY